MHVPLITARAIEPSEALLAAFMSDDGEEFWRLHAELYPEDDDDGE